MNASLSTNFAALALTLTLVACAGPKVQVTSQPVAGSPSAARDKLKPASRELLGQEGLRGEFRKDPDATLRILHRRYDKDGGVDRLVALAELCGTLGAAQVGKNSNAAAEYYLEAAKLSRPGALRGGTGPDGQLRLIYNDACASLALLLHQIEHDGDTVLSFDGPITKFRLSFDRSVRGSINPSFFDDVYRADHLKLENAELERFRQDGIGGALVARRPNSEQTKFMSHAGFALPANASVDFPKAGEARIQYRNLFQVDHVQVGGRSVPLAADWSAPLVYMYMYAPTARTGFKAMLHPAEFDGDTDLYEMSPFDPDKIPVVFVHGLMSSPTTWITTINRLWADPVVRKNYQAVVFRYPTGYPIARNANSLRANLNAYRQHYTTSRSRPQLRRMVMVGHSMGGNLTSMQIRSSGDALRKLILSRPVDHLDLKSGEQETLRDMLVFDADPDIERAVFIAAPHLGSDLAQGPLGRLGVALIKLPQTMLNMGVSVGQELGLEGLTPFGQELLTTTPNSITSLRPKNPFLTEISKLPVSKRTTYHSIIGRANPKDPIPESSDKVVPYWSSHLEGAASEKIVNAKHTTITGNADSIEEVRRILYLHVGRKLGKTPPATVTKTTP
jgi:hypothetical protein